MSAIDITYLMNSGFLVRLGRTALIFDDYMDEGLAVEKVLSECDEVYIFVSHAHFDHFDSHIMQYADYTTKYFFSQELHHTKRAKAFPQDKIVYLPDYSEWEDEAVRVQSFSSTDTGTSFLVEKDGWRIFHAGDFSWWHWKGDTEENIKLARNGFKKQMKRLDGLAADVAFFPVDGRLEEFAALGAREFCARTHVKALVTMHSVGFPQWQPPADFFLPGREIPCWVPMKPGESRKIEKGGEFSK